MNTIISTIIIIVLSFVLTQWLPLPWFTPMIIAFVVGIGMFKMQIKPFLSGFFGIGLFWLIKCLGPFLAKSGTLTTRVSDLFTEQLGFTVTPFILLLLTIIIGGLLGGLSMLSANLLMSKESGNGNSLRSSRKSRSKSYKLKLD